ncbi:MAG: Holliday junction resolvase RuvX [Acidimicrobiales bacterium]
MAESGTGPAPRGARRSVALDLGSRRIGVAVSDSAGTMAFPRPVIDRSGDPVRDHRAIVTVVDEEAAGVVVVGLPLSLDGRRGPAARAAASEAEVLAAELAGRGVRVETFDERFTTVSADAALAETGSSSRERRRSVDSAAAAVLLEAWLAAR